MINLTPKKQALLQGAATLLMTITLLVMSTLIIVFAATISTLLQKSSANVTRNEQAFDAAEAGLEYAVSYLQTNSGTVTANPVSGFINYSLPETTLANNAHYNVIYTNPVLNNLNLLTITATGTSDDGTSTRIITQQVMSEGGTSSLPSAVTGQSNFNASGNTKITGTSGLHTGGSVSTTGTSSISSITQNDATLANIPAATLFTDTFGISESTMQTQSTFYTTSAGVNFNALSGQVWINSNVALSGTHTIGSLTAPVLLIVNGNLAISGNTTIYGVIYVMGTTADSGNFTLNGALMSEGTISMSGVSTVNYNATIVNKFAVNTTIFAKVSGSWKDF